MFFSSTVDIIKNIHGQNTKNLKFALDYSIILKKS